MPVTWTRCAPQACPPIPGSCGTTCTTARRPTAAVSSLLTSAEPPSALFSSQNLITLGTVRALRSCGAQQRTALVGFDDVPLADLLDPPVTVVAQDVAAIGTQAAQILFRRIGGDTSAVRQHVVPTRLVARGSGEIRPVSRARPPGWGGLVDNVRTGSQVRPTSLRLRRRW